jgi:GDP-D-mannose 3',5'-epimerase
MADSHAKTLFQKSGSKLNSDKMKALVLGGGGFIGSHLVKRLKAEGYYVVADDLKKPIWSESPADEFYQLDLRVIDNVERLFNLHKYDEVYQLAADMGGAQYVFTGVHDADIMTNSAIININVATWAHLSKAKKIFYSSSACMYPQELQTSTVARQLKESDAYPANPDSDYGWEKLFSERLFMAWMRNYQLNIVIGRFHNIYGPEGTYYGGKEKAPAAVCRKVSKATEFVENWGDGSQTRSFLYIDDCIDAIRLAMDWDINEPVNIGSEEAISIQDLYRMVIEISGKEIWIKNIPMPEGCMGVAGRNSDNTMIEKITGWKPKYSLKQGLEKTYEWINSQIKCEKLTKV